MDTIAQMVDAMKAQGAERIYAKRLAPNDNSKNQVYVASSFEVLKLFPNLRVRAAHTSKRAILKSSISFSWLSADGQHANLAPSSQLILYPQYPEVRLSGFLKGCANAPSSLMNQKARIRDRVLFFGIHLSGDVIGYVVAPEHPIAHEAIELHKTLAEGTLLFEIPTQTNSKQSLLEELRRIYELNWILGKRLNSHYEPVACKAPNCGGYTLEAELGVRPNGDSKPDYLGWEVKSFGVTKLEYTVLKSKPITLFTPEPTGGYYRDEGVVEFLKRFGYDDVSGRADRKNFGGIHSVGKIQPRTKCVLTLDGYNAEKGSFDAINGGLNLRSTIDDELIIASWSFEALLNIWNRKHAQAVYVPSVRKTEPDGYHYKYGSIVYLGEGTSFPKFLNGLASNNVYYDPGIKVESLSTKPKTKRRSQIRIKAKDLPTLYDTWEMVNIVERT